MSSSQWLSEKLDQKENASQKDLFMTVFHSGLNIARLLLDFHVGNGLGFHLRYPWDRLDLLQEFFLGRVSTIASCLCKVQLDSILSQRGRDRTRQGTKVRSNSFPDALLCFLTYASDHFP